MKKKLFLWLVIVSLLIAFCFSFNTKSFAAVTLTSSPVAAANIAQGSAFNIVYIVKMDVVSLPVTINSLQFTLTGTHDNNDLTTITTWFNPSVPSLTGATALEDSAGR